jgi:ankyrin repeat protein
MAAIGAIEAVHLAASEGDAVSVTRMLDEDPGLLSSVWKGDTLLILAAWKGHVDVVTLLLERGAEIHREDPYGNTALHLAAVSGHEEVVLTLLTSGADPYRAKHRWHTALVSASTRGRVAVIRLLLQAMQGRGLDERCGDGHTALWCVCGDGHADGVRALLLAGADHTIADNSGRTPTGRRGEGASRMRRRDPGEHLPRVTSTRSS